MARETVKSARIRTEEDGAVSAGYRKSAAAKTADKKTEKAAVKPSARRGTADINPSEKKSSGKKEPEKKTTEKKAAEKKSIRREPEPKKPAARKPRKAPEKEEKTTIRGVKAPKEEAPRRRETSRERRERLKMEAVYRDRKRAVSRGIDVSTTLIVLMTVIFEAFGLLLVSMRSGGAMDMRAIRLLAIMAPAALVTALILPRFWPLDPLVMALTNFLCGVGVVILYTVSPERGAMQANYYVLGIFAMLVLSRLVAGIRRFRGLTWLSMVLGIGALLLPLAFGEWYNGAKNWVQLPVVGSFQPSEMVKLSLVLSMAYYFSKHRTVFQMMPAILFAGACLLLLMLQRDLGTALIYYMTTLAMFYAACGNLPLTALGAGGGAAAAVLGYRMFAHVKVRVAMWRNPWSDPLDKGYQIIQALLAIGSGGLFGVGLGQGTPEHIPAYYNDFIFAVICEQLGLVFGMMLLAVYLVLILRGIWLTTRSRSSLHMLLGCGMLAMLGIQTFMIVAGVIKMIPLTGVTMPFLSYGGSSLLSCLSMIGVVHGIGARAKADMEEDVLGMKG